MKVAKYLFIILSFIMLAGCQYDPFAGDYTTNRPAFTDVLGSYKFEQQTVVDSTLASFKMGTITLDADGSYKASNIPNLVNDTTNKGNGFLSATGKWDIESIGAVDNNFGHTKHQWGIVLKNMPESIANIGFLGDTPPYKLIITYDDPDLGQVMIFSKNMILIRLKS